MHLLLEINTVFIIFQLFCGCIQTNGVIVCLNAMMKIVQFNAEIRYVLLRNNARCDCKSVYNSLHVS